MPNDVLETADLTLQPFTEAHLTERYISWLNDPEVVRYSEQRHHDHTRESCESFIKQFTDGPNTLWAISEKSTGRHIGNINTAIDGPNKVADLAIMIGEKDVWGKGYGSQAWNAVMHYLFNRCKIRKITAGTMAVNTGMLSIMARCGMETEGQKKDQFIVDGEPVDMIMAAKFATDVES